MARGLMSDTITVYNCRPVKIGAAIKAQYSKTAITGAMWKENAGRASSDGKQLMEKTVSITIPLEADAQGKSYIAPLLYAALPPGDESHWTLNADGENPDIIVLGECPEEITDSYGIAQLKLGYRAADIKAVSDSTNQRVLPQWKVEAV